MAHVHAERFTEDPERYVDPFDSEATDAGVEGAAETDDSDRDPELRELSDDELFVRLMAYVGETEPLHGLVVTAGTVAVAETAASGYRTLEYAEYELRQVELDRLRESLRRPKDRGGAQSRRRV